MRDLFDLRRWLFAPLVAMTIIVAPPLADAREVGPASAPKLPSGADAVQAAKDTFKPKVTAYFWLLNYDGALRFDDVNGGKGDDINTADDLDIPPGKGTPGMAFELVLANTHILRADLVKQSFAGDMTLTNALVVNGVRFPVGDTVSGALDYLMVTPSYGYQFDHNDKGYLAARVGFSYVSMTGSVTTTETPSNGFAHQIFAPFIGAELSLTPVAWLGFRATIDYLPFGPNPYANGEALITIRPTKKLEGSVGWRYLSVGDEQSRYSFTSTFNGPLATLAFSF